MKKEIYITILLFALMLFALAVTVVRGRSIDADRTEKIGLHTINDEYQIEMNPILPGDVNISSFIPFLEASNVKLETGTQFDVYVLSNKLFETGFAGCELEQPILVRAAPFTRPIILSSV